MLMNKLVEILLIDELQTILLSKGFQDMEGNEPFRAINSIFKMELILNAEGFRGWEPLGLVILIKLDAVARVAKLKAGGFSELADNDIGIRKCADEETARF